MQSATDLTNLRLADIRLDGENYLVDSISGYVYEAEAKIIPDENPKLVGLMVHGQVTQSTFSVFFCFDGYSRPSPLLPAFQLRDLFPCPVTSITGQRL